MTATRLIGYTPNGASLGPIPTPQQVSCGFILNDVGALTFSYPPAAPRAALLGQPLEVAVEVSWDGGDTWQEPRNARFLYLRDGRDPIKTEDAFAVECAGYVLRLKKALVGFDTLGADGKRTFVDATPGDILDALLTDAQTRGALTGLDWDFTTTQDSAGTPWPDTQTISYDPGKDLLSVLQDMAAAAQVDFATDGRTLQVFVPDTEAGLGADRTVGALPVTLRYGRDLTEAPFRRTWEGLADTALVLGDDGETLERTNLGASTPWGRQETYVTASGVKDAGTLQTIADAALTLTAEERAEHTFGLDFQEAVHLPFRDYAPGEWVNAATDGNAPERMRLRSITLTLDETGKAGGNVVLNDRFLEQDVLQSRRIQSLLQGATQAGTGTTPSPSGNDILAPAQVLGLAAGSTAYVEADGRVQAQISLAWTEVTTNADGSPASDVDHYEVHRRLVGGSEWTYLGDSDGTAWSDSPYDPGVDWEFKVRAVDTVFNRGAFSASVAILTASDTVGPIEPSAPTATSRLGVARIAWDGLSAVAGAMDPDFGYVAVHVDVVNGFTPDESNRVGDLGGPGYVTAGPLDYDTTHYARLVPYDSSGNAGTPSAQVAFLVEALVDVSNFPDTAMDDLFARTGHFLNLTSDNFSANLIEGAWLKAGAVTAEKISVYARGNNLLANGNLETEDPNNAGRSAYFGSIYNNGVAVVQANNTATPITGSRSQRLTYAADTVLTYGWLASGGYFSVAEGQKYAARVRIRATAATPAGKNFLLRIHTSKPTVNPYTLFNADAVWTTVDTQSDLVAGQVYTLEGNIEVPAGHTLMAVSLGNEAMGAGVVLDVDAFELFLATTDGSITEVGAGKIRTGLMQATEKVVVGASLTGNRVEVANGGVIGYDATGAEKVRISSITGALESISGDVSVRITTQANAFESGQNWAQVLFGVTGTYNPGIIWGWYGADSPSNAGALQVTAPYKTTLTGDDTARLDLRTWDDGTSRIALFSNVLNMAADTYEVGSADGTSIDWNLQNSQLFQFNNSGNRLALYFGTLGTVEVRARDTSSNAKRLYLDGSSIEFNASGSTSLIWAEDSGGPNWLGRGDGGSGFRFASSEVQVRNQGTTYIAIRASSHPTSSDAAWKKAIKDVAGADALAAIQDLKPRSWKWNKSSGYMDQPGLGFVAQEVLDVVPGAVKGVAISEGGDGLGVDTYPIVGLLVAAVQELAARVVRLEAAKSPGKAKT